VGYKSHSFFLLKEDPELENPVTKQWKQIDLDPAYLNSLNKGKKWVERGHQLKPHQIIGIKFLSFINKGFIFDKVGIGKSNQAMTAAVISGAKKVLIITIKDDVYKWKQLSYDFGQVGELILSKEIDLDALNNANYHIINYDALKKYSQKKMIEFNILAQGYDTIIVDECHNIRNNMSVKANILAKLFNSYSIKRIYGLTATPFETNEQVLGLYMSMGISADGSMPTSNNWLENKELMDSFKERYCAGIKMSNNGKTFVKTSALKENGKKLINTNSVELSQVIKYTYICRSSDDIEGFPDKKINVLNLELPAEKRSKYEQYRNELIEHYKKMNEESDNYINEELPTYTKLRQFLSLVSADQSATFARARANMGEKIIIFTHYNDEFSLLCEKLADVALWVHTSKTHRWRKKDNQEIVNLFKESDEYKILIGNIKTLGTGHNIPEADHTLLNSPNWNNGEHDQAMGRNWRLDREKPVNAWFWIYKDSLTEKVYDRAKLKGENIETLLSFY
jgi:superfamily II DNA or RNA helicase